MHYMLNSGGQTVMPLLRGTSFLWWLHKADNVHALEQNIGLGSSAYTNNAPTHCVYAPPPTSTLEALHTRARARRPRTRIRDKLVRRWSVVPYSKEVVRCAHVLQVCFVSHLSI